MLRRALPPLDSYLGDAMSLDEDGFVARYSWPILVAPEPTPDLKLKLQRPETIVEEIGDETQLDLMAPGMAAASLESLCLEMRPLDNKRNRVRIGRSPNSDVVLIDQSISRAHADVVWDAGTEQAVLVDLAAKNGTYLDQRRLDPRSETILSSGCVLTFGSIVTRYYAPRAFWAWLSAGAPRSGASPAKWPEQDENR